MIISFAAIGTVVVLDLCAFTTCSECLPSDRDGSGTVSRGGTAETSHDDAHPQRLANTLQRLDTGNSLWFLVHCRVNFTVVADLLLSFAVVAAVWPQATNIVDSVVDCER